MGAGDTKDGDYLWVCADCWKPSEGIYEFYVAECEDCGRTFSSPFETLCSFCVRSGSPEREPRAVFAGYAWARNAHRNYLKEIGIAS